MITIQPLAPRVLEVRLSGILTRDDILHFEADFDPLLKDQGPIGVVVHFDGLVDMTADALAEDVRYEVGLIAHLARFKKVAIVSDKQALTAAVRFVDPILAMIDLRTFRPDEAEAARAFVMDLDASRPGNNQVGIKILDTALPSVVAYEIDGWISSRNVDVVFATLEAKVEQQGWVNLLVRWRSFAGFDPRLLGDPDLWAHKIAAARSVRRYALVGAPDWIAEMAERMTSLMPMEICAFDISKEANAWDWVKGEPAQP